LISRRCWSDAQPATSPACFSTKERQLFSVSVSEIQKSIASLSAEELKAVESLLQRLSKRADLQRPAELGRIMREMDSGKKLTLDQVNASLAAHPASE
jgi:hypothetical protein